MSTIFPGMDPYLENPVFWPSVHICLAVYLSDQLQPRLRPRYVATVEERVYVEGPERRVGPDVQIQQTRPLRGRGGVAVMEAVEIDEPMLVRVEEAVRERFVAILDLHADQRVVTVIEIVSPSNKRPGPAGTPIWPSSARYFRATSISWRSICSAVVTTSWPSRNIWPASVGRMTPWSA